MLSTFLPTIMVILALGWLFMAYMATVLLEDAGLGWMLWALVIFAVLMAGGSFFLGVSGLRHQFRSARGDTRVDEIRLRQQEDPSYTVNAAIRDLLVLGKKRDAVRLYQERRGTSADEALRAVEEIERHFRG